MRISQIWAVPISLSLLLTSCATPVSVDVNAGPFNVAISSSSLSLPTELRDNSTSPASIYSVPCGAALPACPSSGSVTVTCNGSSVCDPDPIAVSIPAGDVIDLDALSGGLSNSVPSIDAIEVRSATVVVNTNTLTIPLSSMELYWGTESDTEANLDRHFGTIPGLAAASTSLGDVALDANGVSELSDYLVGTSHRIRVFVRTSVDLSPGGPFPDGALDMTATFKVTARGHVGNSL
ncbi:MAG: hypothetical protein IPK60_15360 [Sandaracinaceae bacterium]|jgi:hypothetical protein|nr:hypothetical protein [Sandaracinaceae bacterium]